MVAQDVRPGFGIRQVHEEDLVETTLAEQLGRQRLDVVGGGHEEDLTRPVLHPPKERSEEPSADSSVSGVRGGKPLLDLVDPQHHGRHCIHRGERGPEPLFTLADELRVEPAGIEQNQWQAPCPGDRLGHHRLAAAWDAGEEHTAWRIEPDLRSFCTASRCANPKPLLQVLEPTDVVECADVCLNQLQNTFVGEQLCFGGPHPGDVLRGYGAVRKRGFLEEALRLADAEPGKCRDHVVDVCGVEGDREAAVLEVLQRSADQRTEFVCIGGPEGPPMGQLPQLGRDAVRVCGQQ